MRRHKLLRPRIIAVAAAVCLLGAGCAAKPLEGVSVKNLSSNLIFGVKPIEEPVIPANTLPIDLDPFISSGPIGPGPAPRPSPTPAPDCPEAPLGSAPPTIAPDSIISPPKEQSHNYRYTVRVTNPPSLQEGIEARVVSDVVVTNSSGPDFRFKVASPKQTLVFSVNQTAPRARAGPSAVPQASARGIFLESIDGVELNPPLKYFDLPGHLGADGAFDTTAVQDNFTTIRHKGQATRHQAVDACGKLIDTWFVDAEQTVSIPSDDEPDGTKTLVSKVSYGVATQFGGLILSEHNESPPNDPEFIYDSRISKQPS